MKDANELRLVANEIIRQLHQRKELGQLQLLLMACNLSVKDLNRPEWEEGIRNSYRMIERSRSTGVEEGK